MFRWMLRVDSWLDVASLENVEDDHSFLFLKRNLMKIFFFWIWKTWIFRRNWKFWIFFFKNLEILNFLKELKILIDDFFFLSNLRSTSPMPLVLRPFLKISFFFFFFFWERFRKIFFFFFGNMKICSLSKSEKDEDKVGVKVMKIYSWWFFFFWLKNLSFEWE